MFLSFIEREIMYYQYVFIFSFIFCYFLIIWYFFVISFHLLSKLLTRFFLFRITGTIAWRCLYFLSVQIFTVGIPFLILINRKIIRIITVYGWTIRICIGIIVFRMWFCIRIFRVMFGLKFYIWVFWLPYQYIIIKPNIVRGLCII